MKNTPEFIAFRSFMLIMDGVTMVGPEHAPVVGVETEEYAISLRRYVHPSIEVIVTGALVVSVEPAPKHPGVQAYERVQNGEFPDFSSIFTSKDPE
jgi:hypothetical protein